MSDKGDDGKRSDSKGDEKNSSSKNTMSRKTVVPKKATSFSDRVVNHKFCSSVDIDEGMWYWCLLCGSVPVRAGRPFTNGHWYEHLDSARHKNNA